MTNEERQHAIEWFKRRPVMMAGAKRMYDLAVEALEGKDIVPTNSALDHIHNVVRDDAYRRGYEQGKKDAEIIRCRDCDWWTKQEASLQGRCALSGTYPTGAWYCANARERGEEE